jgi:Tol biopolymer transport system component
MKPILIYIILTTILAVGSINPSMAQTPEQLYQKGLGKEEGEGALQDAIKIFSLIADNSNADKSLQAKALLHIGMCYEKLGMQEAVKAYQRLVNNYPAQKNEVVIARERLSRLTTIASTNEIAIRQVWTGPDVDNLGSVSADGEYLTFDNWVSGNLAIRNLKTGENKQLTKEGTWKDTIQFALNSLISPDGKQVAYSWYKDRGDKGNTDLRLIRVGNQTPVILYTCSKDLTLVPSLWLSNGSEIIFQEYNISKKIWKLSSINVTDKKFKTLIMKELAPGPGPSFYPVNLSLSHDQKYIAFDFPDPSEHGKYDIFIISVDSKTELPLIEHPANDRLLGWLPGRNELLFTSDRVGTTDVWAINTSGEKPFDEPKCILTNIGDIEIPMGFAQDGSLYFSMGTFRNESFIVPLDNDNGKVSMTKRTSLSGLFYDICWLPDGESLICIQRVVEPDKNLSNILYLLNSRTGETKALASNLSIEGQIRLSPDGALVLVLGRDKKRYDDKIGIYTVNIATGLPVEIKVKQDVSQSNSVEWDKGGLNIYYANNDKIIKHNIESGEEMILHNDKRLLHTILTRSFDGNNLLFDVSANIDEGLCHLLSIPEGGGEARIMCSYNSLQNWRFKRFALSPDGKYIYYSEFGIGPGTKSTLCRIPVAGGTPEKIWELKDYFIAGISIHPEGRQIALAVSHPGIEIRAIENLGRKVAEICSKNE